MRIPRVVYTTTNNNGGKSKNQDDPEKSKQKYVHATKFKHPPLLYHSRNLNLERLLQQMDAAALRQRHQTLTAGLCRIQNFKNLSYDSLSPTTYGAMLW